MVKEHAEDSEQSEFNSAIATLMRINEIKKGLIVSTIQRDYTMKFIYLEAYFLELVSIIKEEDEKKLLVRYNEMRKNYEIYNSAVSNGKKTIGRKIVDSFMEWEIELRNLEQRYGLNLLKKADPRYAIAGKGR